MQVGLKDVANVETLLGSSFEVQINVTSRIDYHRLTPRAEHIRGVRQTAEVKLFEVHSHLLRPQNDSSKDLRSNKNARRGSAQVQQKWLQRS